MPSSSSTTVGLVILTTGDRPDALETIMKSTSPLDFDQRVVVGNGCSPPQAPGWLTASSDHNLGVPGGRTFGIRHTTTDIVVFLDDDSSLDERSDNLVEQIRQVFDAEADAGALAFRVVVEGTDHSLRRWSPMPTRSIAKRTDVPTFPGNGHALRRSAVLSVGGYLDELFFKHEETELSWRLLDAGWRVIFDPQIVVQHPATSEARHQRAVELGLRNKIWISRLRLPYPIAILSCVISIGRSFARCRSRDGLRAVCHGIRTGLGSLPQRRAPMQWSTVLTLTKSGRPPIF